MKARNPSAPKPHPATRARARTPGTAGEPRMRPDRRPRGGRRPTVLINMAMTADGKIATANRAVFSFGSSLDHEHLLELRATVDAVMAGARTVDLEPVNLGPGGLAYRRQRLKRGLAEYNLRVVVSRLGTVDPRAMLFRKKFSPVLVLTTERASQAKLKSLRAVADEVKVCGTREIDFHRALRWLGRRWGVRRLLCEGGGELNDALVQAGLVDEIHLTVCPTIVGGREAPTIADGKGASRLAKATRLALQRARRRGQELFLEFRVVKTSADRRA
jgi:2,5-diamino-6-(ribosylamino)-4(3H)-pyrimidinone 5'-phosphate reductase